MTTPAKKSRKTSSTARRWMRVTRQLSLALFMDAKLDLGAKRARA